MGSCSSKQSPKLVPLFGRKIGMKAMILLAVLNDFSGRRVSDFVRVMRSVQFPEVHMNHADFELVVGEGSNIKQVIDVLNTVPGAFVYWEELN